MLEIKGISKIYETDDLKQTALNDVSIIFRKCEFTCILGPSGSGKTTLLNIIGGLDQYDKGDLVINEVSTKKYNDRDWDSYRNHRIGFVFQNYNLITHQSVLKNVELALTLSGVSKDERIKRAKKALDEVGLKEHINKKPNQLSGGQMQRVAIARALVNNPDILLADEPTGALDSATSVQIMKLLKKVSKDKLVIMVTHNPDLANEYSNRIINLKDGKIVGDTNPYKGEVNTKEAKEINKYKSKKTSMSFKTALSLSFNNLMIKKKRTILVSFASSIGIIGIALILSVATGFQNYIDKIQEDTLSSYPLTITSETADMTSMLLSMVSGEKGKEKDDNIVTEEQYISTMFSSLQSNDLKSFNSYLTDNYGQVENYISSIKYSYSVVPNIYTIDAANNLAKLNPSSLMTSVYSSSVSSLASSYSSIFSQMVDDKTMLEEDYDVLAGHYPEKYNEMIIVLSEPNKISDLLVYSLGLRNTEELNTIITKIISGEEPNINNEPLKFTYDELMNIELKLIETVDIYKYNAKYDIYEDMSGDDAYMKKIYNESEPLKIVGIVAPKKGVTTMTLMPGVAYKAELVDHIINNASETSIIKKQLANENIDVFSNNKFGDEKAKSKIDFEDLISVDTKKLEKAFGGSVKESDITNLSKGYMDDISEVITTDISPAKTDFNNTLSALSKGVLTNYITNPKETRIDPLDSTKQVAVLYLNDIDSLIDNYFVANANLFNELESKYVVPKSMFLSVYKPLVKGMIQSYIASYYLTNQSLTVDSTNPGAAIYGSTVDGLVTSFMSETLVITTSDRMAHNMVEAVMQKQIFTKVGELTGDLVSKMASAFKVDPKEIASAFTFDLSEDELSRIMNAMITSETSTNANTNLISLGYQDKKEPTSISFYFKSFESKENFIKFIDKYNDKVKKDGLEDKKISYTDITGILMSSVKTVVDSVSYVLMAFVSISLIVSSIMIGVITYISVLERTKEIGILRAIGASKRNISSIFNAETFIVGLLSGIIGIGISLLLIIPINMIIASLTGTSNISATLPFTGGVVLIILSVILTLIGGLIPSKMASKKDPVESLRSE